MTVSAADIVTSLTQKIASGRYPSGARLPSCRELAAELGINRNTAHKVYQELSRQGLVRSWPGRGYVVTGVRPDTMVAATSIQASLLAAGREARLLGLRRDDFMRLVHVAVDQLYQHDRPRIAFIECNEDDARTQARQIEQELDCSIEPVLLETLEADPARLAAGYDIICTNLYHLSDVTQLLPGALEKVVAIHAPPDNGVLMALAQLGPGARVGVVCAFAATVPYVLGAVSMVFHGEIESCLLSDTEQLLAMGQRVDLIIDGPGNHAEVMRLLPTVRLLTIRFRVAPDSLGPLRGRVRQSLAAPAGAAAG